MFKIIIDLVRLTKEEAEAQHISASAFIDEMNECERLARDILAPLSVHQLMKEEGDKVQQINAQSLGRRFLECSAECGGALWFCGDQEDAQRLTVADGFKVRAFGRIHKDGCFILILENQEEEERAYLVRPSW